MFLCSLIKELCTEEENDKTGCNFNFGHECNIVLEPNEKKICHLIFKIYRKEASRQS